jgi:hypothetical protein
MGAVMLEDKMMAQEAATTKRIDNNIIYKSEAHSEAKSTQRHLPQSRLSETRTHENRVKARELL